MGELVREAFVRAAGLRTLVSDLAPAQGSGEATSKGLRRAQRMDNHCSLRQDLHRMPKRKAIPSASGKESCTRLGSSALPENCRLSIPERRDSFGGESRVTTSTTCGRFSAENALQCWIETLSPFNEIAAHGWRPWREIGQSKMCAASRTGTLPGNSAVEQATAFDDLCASVVAKLTDEQWAFSSSMVTSIGHTAASLPS